MKSKQKLSVGRSGSLKKSLSANMYMYILLAPAVICVLIFGYAPLCGLLLAFKDYDALLGFAKSPWVGLQNIINIFHFPNFLHAIKNTLLYSSVCLFGQFPFPIILAIMLNEVRSKSFKKISQTVTYLPHFLSWISVVGFAYSMFSLYGPFNSIMASIFGSSYERTNILLDSHNFLGFIFFSGLWKEVGWNSILYLAAIAGIDPSELFIAAVTFL